MAEYRAHVSPASLEIDGCQDLQNSHTGLCFYMLCILRRGRFCPVETHQSIEKPAVEILVLFAQRRRRWDYFSLPFPGDR